MNNTLRVCKAHLLHKQRTAEAEGSWEGPVPQSETQVLAPAPPGPSWIASAPRALWNGAHYRMQGKNILGLCRTYYGMLKGENKGEKG